jgi:hypothetical protein
MGSVQPTASRRPSEHEPLYLRFDLEAPTPATGGFRSPADSDVGFLFAQCRSPVTGLSDSDYSSAATSLGVEIAAIKAVADVETSGKAFDESGRPRILFERHYFHRLTSGKYSATHPDISNATAGGYGKFSAQYGKLEQAFKLDPDAALSSASWGRFQIMGDNFRAAGFTSVRAFVLAMTSAESEHLKATRRCWLHYVKKTGQLSQLPTMGRGTRRTTMIRKWRPHTTVTNRSKPRQP